MLMADSRANLAEGNPFEINIGTLEYNSDDYNSSQPYDSSYSSEDDGWTLHTVREEVTTITPRAPYLEIIATIETVVYVIKIQLW